MDINKITTWIAVGTGVLVIVALGVWFFFFRASPTLTTDTQTPSATFDGSTDASNTVVPTNTTAENDPNGTAAVNTTAVASQLIFKISDGPLVGATLIQTLRPTTTLARYIRQDDGHVFDVPLGVSGAVPKVVSNITIPGGQRVLWTEGGQGALMQYVEDDSVVKTVYLGFPTATSSRGLQPTRIQFLPDNIADIAVSPDGKSAAYLLKTAAGSDGYIAKADGTGAKKLFSLPFSQLLITWPAQSTLLAQTKSATGVSGMAFSINISSGATSPVVSAEGLTTGADRSFSTVIYQTTSFSNQKPLTYAHNIKSGTDFKLAYNPIPEKCIWSKLVNTKMFCASPLTDIPLDYLDAWHMGTYSLGDTIFIFDLSKNVGKIFAIPGSIDGGEPSNILEMTLSPDERYLTFTTKGGRQLWGVLLKP